MGVVGADSQRLIEEELAGERAGALAQAVEALERALHELEHGKGRREHLFAEACERLWYVVVQREAIGLTRHQVVFEVLRVPSEVRRLMGPRRSAPWRRGAMKAR